MTLQSVADRILTVVAHRPAGLYSDFDGALSEIAPTPGEAVAYPGAAEALNGIARQLDSAGIITGRAVDDVARMISIDEFVVVGNHGLEWWDHGNRHDHEAGLAAIAAITAVLDAAHQQLAAQMDVTDLIWENKRLSGTIHFRNVADPEGTEALLLPIVVPLAEAHGLRCTPGKMIVEIRPQALVTKGTAINALFEKYGLESGVYIGDDVTDVDGFRALRELRSQGKQTLAVGVVTPDAHPDVLDNADETVGSVDELVRVLSIVATMLERGS